MSAQIRIFCRIDAMVLGSMSMTIIETGGQTKTITIPEATSSRYYHGDSTNNTSDSVAPADNGTACLGVALLALINAAGLDNTYALTFDGPGLYYTFSRASGSKAFALSFSRHGEAGKRMRRLLGFEGDRAAAASHAGLQDCWYLILANERAVDTDDQTDAGPIGQQVASNGRTYTVGPYASRKWRTYTFQFHSHAEIYSKDDATGETWAWDAWKEWAISGERFLLFASSVTTLSFANAEAVCGLRKEGMERLRFERQIPNSDLYWAFTLDCWVESIIGSVQLLDFAEGTFTRASVGTYQSSASTIPATAAVDVPRYEDLGDGNGAMLLLEGASTNLLQYSEQLGTAPWGVGGALDADACAAPDGATTADRVRATAGVGTSARVYQQVTIAATTKLVLSAWCQIATQNSKGGILVDQTNGLVTDINPTPAAWTREYNTVASCAINPYSLLFSCTGGDAGTPTSGDNCSWWGAQLESGRSFPSSYIKTTNATASRAADTLTFTAGQVPAALRSGRWRLDFAPLFSSADMVSGNVFVLVSFGGANDCVRLRHDGTNRRVEVVRSGSVVAASGYITWSRAQKLRAVFDSAAGTVEVALATTGNGVGAVGTAWVMPSASVRVGGIYGSTSEAFCRLDVPRSA